MGAKDKERRVKGGGLQGELVFDLSLLERRMRVGLLQCGGCEESKRQLGGSSEQRRLLGE